MITTPVKFLIAISLGTKQSGWKLNDNLFLVLCDICMHFSLLFIIKNFSKFEF